MYFDGVSGVPQLSLDTVGFLVSAIFSAPLHKNRAHRLVLYALTLCCVIYSVLSYRYVAFRIRMMIDFPDSLSPTKRLLFSLKLISNGSLNFLKF